MKKALLYCPVDLNRLGGTPFRIIKVANALAKAGYNIILVATGIDKSERGGFTFIELRRKSFLRWIDASEFSSILDKIKPDVVYSFAHSSLITARVCKKRNIPLIAELHGLDSYSFLSNHHLPGFFGWFFLPLMRYLVKGVDYLVLVTPALEKFYRNTGIPKEVMVMGTGLHSPRNGKKETRGEKVIVMYAGNFKKHQGIDLLFKAIRILNKKGEKKFLFYFMGQSKNDFSRYVKKYAVQDLCKSLGKPKFEETARILGAADVFVLPWTHSYMGKYCSASKLPDYIAMQKPIICTKFGDSLGLVKENGITVNEKPGELVSALYAMAAKYEQFKRNAERYDIQSITMESNVKMLKKIFNEVVTGN